MLNVNIFCFFASYVVAFAIELTRLRGWTTGGRWATLIFASAGFLAHTIYLFSRAAQTNLPPLLSSPQDWFLVVTWMVVATYVITLWVDGRFAAGLVVLPLVLIVTGGSWFVTASPNLVTDAPRGWRLLHVSLLALGALAVLSGLICSLLYLWQHRRLKNRQSAGKGLLLPSLEQLERLNRVAIMSAVPLMTLGMLTGLLLTLLLTGGGSSRLLTDPLVLVSIAGWVVLCILFAQVARGQKHPGRRVASLTVWSCGFLLLSVLGVQMLTSQMHTQTIHGRAVEREAAP